MQVVKFAGSATVVSNTYTMVATDTDGIAASQTPAGAGALTLNGVLVSSGAVTLDTPQRISVSCAANDTARTFTIVGRDADGHAQTKTMAGNSGSITNGTDVWSYISSVSVDAATAGAITVGVQNVGQTPWIPLNNTINPFNFAYSVDVGTATFTVETSVIPMTNATVAATGTIQASGGVDVNGNSTIPARYVRINVSAFTSGAIKFYILQAGPVGD